MSKKKPIDLIEKYKKSTDILNSIKKLPLLKTHPKYKVGQIITFYAGYNRDILYKSKITGFDTDGDIYVLWDCYWSPIRDDSTRKITVVTDSKTGLKAPATKGLTTLCAKMVCVTGRRKKDGTQKKGYIATKGGKLVKKTTAKKVKM